ncbi:MAG: thioredoxin domain-containing protein [Deltaproteobacteria bacterium]|nr:thioredoxin domain-containing protein [Deltaproteobacteria bacterium]
MRAVALAVLLVASAASADPASFDPASVYKVPRGTDDPTDGPATAPVTIVEWSDYACGYCNRVQDTLDKLARIYPGRLRWIHRTLPLDDDNTLAAEAALAAAAQGRFEPMHARLFAVHGRVDRPAVEAIARSLGLDMIRFRADLDAGTYHSTVVADVRDAVTLGVTGTPTFFVNGRPVHGNQPLKVFIDTVGDELARADKMAATHPADLYEALVADGKLAADAPTDANNDQPELDPNMAYRVGLGLPGHAIGRADALVTIVEFSDFQCPFCAREAPVLAHVRQKYGDAVRIVYRHMPVHRDAVLAAEAAVAAAEQGKFWAFHDQVFAHFGHLTRADLDSFAKAAGLDMATFDKALDTRRYHDAVISEYAAAEAFGVDGTPTLFINGQPMIGARDEALFDKVIDAHLAHANDAIAHGIARGELYPLMMSMAKGAELGDPSSVPTSTVVKIEMRADDRERAVTAACRRHDAARAKSLASGLAKDLEQRAAAVCSGEGVDL